MAVSDVSICNLALTKIGAQRILSLDDNTDRAKLLKEVYPIVRDTELSNHPWNFATARAELSALASSPIYEWSYQFQLPADCLRVYGTDLPKEASWKVEGGKLLCDYDTIKIQYIKRVTETSLYSAYFIDALACAIAATIAYAVTQSTTLRDSMRDEYKSSVRTARSFDAQEGAGDRVYADSWLNSRA